MKGAAAVCIVSAITLLCMSPAALAQGDDSLRGRDLATQGMRLTDLFGGFSLEMPTGWALDPQSRGGNLLLGEPGGRVVCRFITMAPSPLSLQEQITAFRAAGPYTYKRITKVREDPGTVDGERAGFLETRRTTQSGAAQYAWNVITVRHTLPYVLDCHTGVDDAESVRAAVRALFGSVRWVPAARTDAALPESVAETPPEERLVVTKNEDVFRVSVALSHLVMTIPNGDFELVEDTAAKPRYFQLEDRKNGIIVSGWFEPADLYHGMKHLWKKDTRIWSKSGLPAPTHETFQSIDQWDVVLYDVNVPNGSNTHVRAEWVEAETWIDVHISVTTPEPVDVARASALAVLKEIRVTRAW